jgi:hypothetical protein
VAESREGEAGQPGQTALLVIALCGAVTPLAVAAFARDRLWHEGVLGFFVAVGFGLAVATSDTATWQRRTARVLLRLAGVTVVVVIVLGVLLLAAIGKNGLPP